VLAPPVPVTPDPPVEVEPPVEIVPPPLPVSPLAPPLEQEKPPATSPAVATIARNIVPFFMVRVLRLGGGAIYPARFKRERQDKSDAAPRGAFSEGPPRSEFEVVVSGA